ncbi:MAG: hypothetical protein KGJ21_10880 [Pseudomonadota bacterium]|nr:hypothetical protein [Pseudomonadota bacterium]
MKNNKQESAIAELYNGAWWLRNYSRPAKKAERALAVRALGLAARRAFNESEDFEPLLRALADGLAGAWPQR